MQIGKLHISNSLIKLLEKESESSPCLKLLYLALNRMIHNVDDAHMNKRGYWRPINRPRSAFLLDPDKWIGNYFTFRENVGMISYMPKGREQVINDDGTWKREGRQAIKPAKWLRSMFHPHVAKKIKDHHWAKFDTCVKSAEEASKVTFEEVPFNRAYDYNNYRHEHGIDSCMWGKPVEEFYESCGAKAIVAVDRDGKYRGRAILWPKVKIMGEADKFIQFMDRVYSDRPEILELFLEHAKENGWHHKMRQSRDSRDSVISPDGTFHEWRMIVETGDLSGIEYYPYLDTFASGDDVYLYNSEDSHQFDYTATDGTREQEDMHEGEVQDVDGEWIEENDAVEVNGDWYAREDERIVICHRSDNYILRDDAYEVDVGGRIGTIYLHEDYVIRA